MSIASDVAAVVETATGTRWVRIAWRLAPWIVILLLAAALQATRVTLQQVRLTDRAQAAEAAAGAARAHAADAGRVADAASAFAARTAALQPLIVHSTDTVTRYADTPAGRAACLDADRVRGLDALDASLAATAGAPGGAGPVPAVADPSSGGR